MSFLRRFPKHSAPPVWHYSLNSLSEWVLYIFSEPVSAYPKTKIQTRQLLKHFVYKTNGILMIPKFFSNKPQFKIIFLDHGIITQWFPYGGFQNTVASLYGIINLISGLSQSEVV